MIDLHNHILPNLDDGPSSWETSLNMCRQAVANGIKTIVATPHTLNGAYDNKPQDIEEKVKILNLNLQSQIQELAYKKKNYNPFLTVLSKLMTWTYMVGLD